MHGYGSMKEMSLALEAKDRTIKKLKKKIDDMEKSTSLRVGRAVTLIPRKIRKALRK